jgi:hypothetical protein
MIETRPNKTSATAHEGPAGRTYRCQSCGEYRQAALHNGEDLCRNCANREHAPAIRRCWCCGRLNVPGQFHHLARQRHCPWLGRETCVNCHAIFTLRMEQDWPGEAHEVAPVAIVQGLYDYLVLSAHSTQLADAFAWLRDFLSLAWEALTALLASFGLRAWRLA